MVEGGLGMVEAACCWRGPGLPPVAGAVCARCPLLTHPPPIISSIHPPANHHSLSGDAGGGGGGCSRLCNRDPWTVICDGYGRVIMKS